MMATTGTNEKPETQYRVTMLIDGSKIEAVGRMTKEKVGGVAVEKVEKIEPFVPGEWDVKRQRERDDEPGNPLKDHWVNTDGREIFTIKKVKPGYEKKFFDERKWIDVYVVKDKYGTIDRVDTLEQAKNVVRPASTTEEILSQADTVAKIMRNLEADQTSVDVANNYLAMRRISTDDEEEYGDEDKRRKPRYEIKLTVEGSKKDTILHAANGIFGKMLVGVELVRYGGSRADDLDVAHEKVEDALKTVQELKGDLEDWKEGMPEQFQGGQKEEELDQAASNLEDIENALDGIDWDVEFPGMF
jgi:hypothetical protein